MSLEATFFSAPMTFCSEKTPLFLKTGICLLPAFKTTVSSVTDTTEPFSPWIYNLNATVGGERRKKGPQVTVIRGK